MPGQYRSLPSAPPITSLSDIPGLIYEKGSPTHFPNPTDILFTPGDSVTNCHLFVACKHDNLVCERTGLSVNRFFYNKRNTGNKTIGLRSLTAEGVFRSVILLDGSESTTRFIDSLGHSSQIPHTHEIFYDGSTFAYLIDNYYQDQKSYSGQLDPDNVRSNIIGNHENGVASAEGWVYEIALYDRKLDPAEIRQVLDYMEGIKPASGSCKQGMVLARGSDEGFKSPGIQELDANTWVMFYSVLQSGAWQGITYATSPKSNPHNWTKSNDIIIPSSAGGWDQNISDVWGIKDGGEWKFLYADRVNGGIGLATGPGLSNLTKHPSNPVFPNPGSGWDKYVRYPTFAKIGGVFQMLYDGRSDSPTGRKGGIGFARSADLVTWVKNSAAAIPSQESEGGGWAMDDIGQPSLVLHNGSWYVSASGFNEKVDLAVGGAPHQIGVFRCECPGGWTALNNPVMGWTYGDWDLVSVSDSCLWSLDGKLLCYYVGRDNPSGGDIGYAEILNP